MERSAPVEAGRWDKVGCVSLDCGASWKKSGGKMQLEKCFHVFPA